MVLPHFKKKNYYFFNKYFFTHTLKRNYYEKIYHNFYTRSHSNILHR